MALSRVELTPEVFRTCVSHALTTEAEEIMGLLLGDVHVDPGGAATARIWVAMPQIRTDRRKDRVEASPEQLATATALADQLTESSQRTTRVIGWYHSHPHITVLPSHVDVRTQAMYQNMDEGFIGLIFSVFNEDGDKGQTVQMTAFQSMRQGSMTSFPQQRGSWDFDSPMAAAISASMAEARSAASHQGQWVQKRVPIVVPTETPNGEAGLQSADTVSRVLFEEEQHAFRRAVQDSTNQNGEVDPLTAIHQAAEYHQHLARLIELVVGPTLQSLQAASQQARWRQQQLIDLRDALQHRAQAVPTARPPQPPLSQQSPRSPGNDVGMAYYGGGQAQQPSAPSMPLPPDAAQGGLSQAEQEWRSLQDEFDVPGTAAVPIPPMQRQDAAHSAWDGPAKDRAEHALDRHSPHSSVPSPPPAAAPTTRGISPQPEAPRSIHHHLGPEVNGPHGSTEVPPHASGRGSGSKHTLADLLRESHAPHLEEGGVGRRGGGGGAWAAEEDMDHELAQALAASLRTAALEKAKPERVSLPERVEPTGIPVPSRGSHQPQGWSAEQGGGRAEQGLKVWPTETDWDEDPPVQSDDSFPSRGGLAGTSTWPGAAAAMDIPRGEPETSGLSRQEMDLAQPPAHGLDRLSVSAGAAQGSMVRADAARGPPSSHASQRGPVDPFDNLMSGWKRQP